MAKKFPPKGYFAEEYPLPHNFTVASGLFMENEAKNSTIIPILRASEACLTPESIVVNPRNSAFAEDTGATIHMGSIVPRISFKLMARMTKTAIETDGVRSMIFSWFPIYISFLDTLEAEDDKTAVQIEDILELQHDTGNKDTYPLYSGTDVGLVGHTVPMSTIADADEAFGDWGLTTNTIIESVAFDESLMFDALQYYTNKGMLQTTIGKRTVVHLTRDRAYRYFSNNFTYPKVKRGNKYTFCGIMIHVPQADSVDQLPTAGELTGGAQHLDIRCRVRYDEWNPNFDQTAV